MKNNRNTEGQCLIMTYTWFVSEALRDTARSQGSDVLSLSLCWVRGLSPADMFLFKLLTSASVNMIHLISGGDLEQSSGGFGPMSLCCSV